jgi:hypothetical protein
VAAALAVAAWALLTPAPLAARSTQLTPATLAAFARYVAMTERRIDGELSGQSPFLWIDRLPAAGQTRLIQRLRAGEVISERLETLEHGRTIDPDDGIIHHWIGTVLIPRSTLLRTKAFVQSYDRYSEYFAPMIQRSRLVSRTGDRFTAALRTWSSNLGVTVVLDGDYTVDYRTIDPQRLFTRSVAANFHEVSSPGTPEERRHPADQREAFLWRLNTYCSFEQRPEGVYEQCESISLTRSIPWMVRFIVKPLVTGIPRETLEATLGVVRDKAQ